MFGAAGDEFAVQLLHQLDLLLAHGLAQCVGLPASEARQHPRKQHHLLLIDGDAVGVVQDLAHFRDGIGDLFQPLFSADKGRDVVHRSRSVEGDHGDDVLETRRLQFAQVFAHTGTFKLEYCSHVAFAEQFVGLLVF